MKLFQHSLKLVLTGCAFALSFAAHGQLCQAPAEEPSPAPLDALIEEMGTNNIVFKDADRLKLSRLISNFGVDEIQWPTEGLAVQAAETIAPLVSRGNMVAAEIAQLSFEQVAISWTMSPLRDRIDRLLRSEERR